MLYINLCSVLSCCRALCISLFAMDIDTEIQDTSSATDVRAPSEGKADAGPQPLRLKPLAAAALNAHLEHKQRDQVLAQDMHAVNTIMHKVERYVKRTPGFNAAYAEASKMTFEQRTKDVKHKFVAPYVFRDFVRAVCIREFMPPSQWETIEAAASRTESSAYITNCKNLVQATESMAQHWIAIQELMQLSPEKNNKLLADIITRTFHCKAMYTAGVNALPHHMFVGVQAVTTMLTEMEAGNDMQEDGKLPSHVNDNCVVYFAMSEEEVRILQRIDFDRPDFKELDEYRAKKAGEYAENVLTTEIKDILSPAAPKGSIATRRDQQRGRDTEMFKAMQRKYFDPVAGFTLSTKLLPLIEAIYTVSHIIPVLVAEMEMVVRAFRQAHTKQRDFILTLNNFLFNGSFMSQGDGLEQLWINYNASRAIITTFFDNTAISNLAKQLYANNPEHYDKMEADAQEEARKIAQEEEEERMREERVAQPTPTPDATHSPKHPHAD